MRCRALPLFCCQQAVLVYKQQKCQNILQLSWGQTRAAAQCTPRLDADTAGLTVQSPTSEQSLEQGLIQDPLYQQVDPVEL